MYNSFVGIKEEENVIKAVSALIAGTAFTIVYIICKFPASGIPSLKLRSQMIP